MWTSSIPKKAEGQNTAPTGVTGGVELSWGRRASGHHTELRILPQCQANLGTVRWRQSVNASSPAKHLAGAQKLLSKERGFNQWLPLAHGVTLFQTTLANVSLRVSAQSWNTLACFKSSGLQAKWNSSVILNSCSHSLFFRHTSLPIRTCLPRFATLVWLKEIPPTPLRGNWMASIMTFDALRGALRLLLHPVARARQTCLNPWVPPASPDPYLLCPVHSECLECPTICPVWLDSVMGWIAFL